MDALVMTPEVVEGLGGNAENPELHDDSPAPALRQESPEETQPRLERPESRRQRFDRERLESIERSTEALDRARKAEKRADDSDRRHEELLREIRSRPAERREPERREARVDDDLIDGATARKIDEIEKLRWKAVKEGDTAEWDRLGRQQMALVAGAAASTKTEQAMARMRPQGNQPHPVMLALQGQFTDVYYDNKGKARPGATALLAAFDAQIAADEGLEGPALWRRAHEDVQKYIQAREGGKKAAAGAVKATNAAERAAYSGGAAPRGGGGGGSASGEMRIRLPMTGSGTSQRQMNVRDIEKHVEGTGRTVEDWKREWARLHPEDVIQ